MDLFLLVIYIAVFVLQIVWLVAIIRKKAKRQWVLLFLSELLPMLVAIELMKYYDNLPGYGFMPGLCYLGEVLFSFGAAVLYGIFFVVSVCCCIVVVIKQVHSAKGERGRKQEGQEECSLKIET